MTTPANNPNGSAVGTAWADNMPLDILNTYADSGTVNSILQQQASDLQRFWATPARPATSTTQEVMQVTLSSARLINQVIFDVAMFPQVVRVEYFDAPTGAWLPCLDPAAPLAVEQSVLSSFPGVLPPTTSISGHVHPQHSFSGHWKTLEFGIRPVTARLLRVLLQRTVRGTPPTNPFGTLVDYSLAVRNFYVGYQVSSADDVPDTTPFATLVNTDGSFASTTDLLGSAVSYKVNVDAAENVLRNQQTEQSVVWKCEPQPVPWAVVNFYLDTRDDAGNAQVIDRFFLEPYYNGPSCHIYYSNDEVTSAYNGSTDPLPYPFATVHDPNGVGGDVLHSGLPGLNAVAFVDIDNQVLSFNPGRAWWVGASLNFKLGHGSEIVDTPIFDCGAFNIALTPFGLNCTTQFGDTLAINVDAFDPATTLTVLVAYDGISMLTINAKQAQVFYEGLAILPVPLIGTTVNTIRLGGFQDTNPGVNNCDFNALVLKTDDVPDADVIADFLDDPEPYVAIAGFRANADERTSNALMRYHRGWATDTYPAGVIGGEPDHYAELIWAPVARDYILAKGFYDVPPTKAKYWKFEFTGLVPESYEVYKPITRVVKTFSTSMGVLGTSVSTFPSTQTLMGTNLGAVYQVNKILTAQFDAYTTNDTGTGAAALGLTPTQVRVILDPASRKNVGNVYWAWNFLPVNSSSVAPSFTSIGVHTYEQVNVSQVTKIAYFVGLVSVVAYRLDAVATNDVLRYVDNFFDLTNIAEDTNWQLIDDHQLTSGASHYAVVKSEPFSSSRIVAAVQFATQQSEPIQLLPDAEFDDPTHANWTAVGDASFAPGITVDTTVGNTVKISRVSQALDWDTIMAAYPLWSSITSLNLTYDNLATAFENAQLQGGITSAPVTVPAGGRVSVAARVIAPGDLDQQLWVQVVDDATSNVLAEEPITVKAHQVTEWLASYTVGELDTPPWRWQDFFPVAPTTVYFDSFAQANNVILPAMDSGQQWSYNSDLSGNPLSLSIVSNKAVATVEGHSNFVNVNTPWGTLEFVVGTMGANGNANLIVNPQFTTNTTGWSVTNSGTVTRITGGVVGAAFSGQVKSTTATLPTALTNATIISGLVPGTTYRFAFDINPGFSGTFQPGTSFYGPFPTLIASVSVNVTVVSGVTQHIETTWVVPAGASQVNLFMNGGTLPVNTTFNISNIIFQPVETLLAGFDPFQIDDLGVLNDRSGTILPAAFDTNVLTTSNTARLVQANDDIRIDILPTYLVPGGRQDIAHGSNPDPVVWPYSLMFFVNGSWVRTVSHDMGARLLRTLKGHLNQQFKSWSWTPFPYGALPGNAIMYLPRLDNGFWLDAVTLSQFQDPDGNVWNATGSWDLSTPPELLGMDNYGPPLTSAANSSTFVVDTGLWYGALSAYVRTVAGSVAGPTHGFVLCLDFDHGIFVNAAGNIVDTIGTNYGNLIPGGIANNSMVTVHWVRTAQVTAATRGTINATTFPDMLVGKVNGQIVGTFASALLQTWRGTQRGLAGDIYDPTGGSRPTTPNYTLDTSFRAFHWAPDASVVAQKSTAPTWNDVTAYNSTTYDHVLQGRTLDLGSLRAQLVQFGESQDEWEVDNLSMFVDPIVWSFSNDGGSTFYPAYDIKNNPRGVFSFPQSTVVTQLGLVPGTALVWKATCYMPGQYIASLVIRPWYAGLLSNVLRRIGLGVSGPNLMPYDHTPPIEQDPSFQVWNSPIPQSWWYQFKLIQRAQTQQGGSSTSA